MALSLQSGDPGETTEFAPMVPPKVTPWYPMSAAAEAIEKAAASPFGHPTTDPLKGDHARIRSSDGAPRELARRVQMDL